MKIFDISMTISEDMMVYKNKEGKKPKIFQSANFEENNHYESELTLNLHTGTHIDAPLHIIDGGSTMAAYLIEDFVSQAKVLDLTHLKDNITEEDLRGKNINEGDFILLKTRNSSDVTFNHSFVYLEKSGAKYLKNQKIKGIGIDALGIERNQPDHETHKILLNKGIMILEGLQLHQVDEGEYELIVLPLKLMSTEAAPARAILIKR
ncbi:MAG: cyclase [Firmicutes bacterium HGW-Firmicutes-1]|jgi:arylformamidase|nr:MAG: cyclase [Firmicutes bacterium HGW-Firmicutes-1]